MKPFKIFKDFGKKTASGAVSVVQFLQTMVRGAKGDYYSEWVYAGISKIAFNLARVEWELYTVKGKNNVSPVDTSPILGLLYTFNGKTTRFEAMAKTVLGFLFNGEVGWYIGERKNGKPTAIYVVSKREYRIDARDEFGYPKTYVLSMFGGVSKIVPASDLLIIRNVNPNSNEVGFALVDALKDVADTDFFISRWNKNLMQNDAQPSAIVKIPAGVEVTQEEAKFLKKEIAEALSGYENSHKVGFLQKGAELIQTAINPKELDFNKSREFNRDLILSVIGTPKTLLGLDNGVTKATAETAERIFAKYTLEPILQQITEWINEYLIPYYDPNAWLAFTPLASEDEEQKLNEMDKGHNRWLTTNDCREMSGKEPVSGGDYIYLPLTSVPMIGGTSGAKDYPYIKIKATRAGNLSYKKANEIEHRVNARKSARELRFLGDNGERISDAFSKKMDELKTSKKVFKVIAKKSFAKEEKDLLWKQYISLKRTSEETLKSLIMQIFEKQKKEIMRNIEEQGKKDAKVSANDILFDKQKEINATISVIEPQYFILATQGLEMAGASLGTEPLAVNEIPALVTWLKNIVEKYAESITETTYTQLGDIIQNGISNGSTIYELGNSIEDYFGNIAPSRADMIARTESARAMTASEAYGWDSYGIKYVEWYPAGSDTCEICLSNASEKWTIEDAKDGTISYSHPNCECLFLPL